MKENDFSFYSILSHDEFFIVFGGRVAKVPLTFTSTIAKFDEKTDKWSQLGNMNVAKHSIGVIYDGQAFVLVGGSIGTDFIPVKAIVFSRIIMTPKLKVFPIFSADGSFDAEWSICL